MIPGASRSLILRGRVYILILQAYWRALQQIWEVWRIRKITLMKICWSCCLGNSICISASRSSSLLSTGRKVHQICIPLRVYGSFSQGQFYTWIEDEMKAMPLRHDIYHGYMQLDNQLYGIYEDHDVYFCPAAVFDSELGALETVYGQEMRRAVTEPIASLMLPVQRSRRCFDTEAKRCFKTFVSTSAASYLMI